MNEIPTDQNIPIDKNTKKKLFSTFIESYFELLNIMKSKFEIEILLSEYSLTTTAIAILVLLPLIYIFFNSNPDDCLICG